VKSIKDTLNKYSYSERFENEYQKFKEIILLDSHVKAFLEENRAFLNRKIFDKGIMKLYEFSNQSKECNDCPSLSECKNIVKGYHPHLYLKNKQTIDIEYTRCPSKEKYDHQKNKQNKIKSVYIPSELLKASIHDIYEEEENRFRIKQLVWEFIESYGEGKRVKGLYISGGFGVGKTFILCAIANELASIKNAESMIVYFPEFIREIKSVMGNDQLFNAKLEAAKKTPVLMLDDIGAESMTSWMRDEILGPILQHRMLDHLPTFFSSNLSPKELLRHYTYSQKGEEEGIKAQRILERIKYLASEIELVDVNRRT
jgi:primosomal protein DnaI